MRIVSFAFAALSVALVTFSIAAGCGLDGVDVRYATVDAGIDVATGRDGNGVLDEETNPTLDGSVDADNDADVFVDPGCPSTCSSCTDAGVCQIDCTSAKGNCSPSVTCPPGKKCRVVCNGANACAAITCSKFQDCSVVCETPQACKDAVVTQNLAAKFCMQCDTPNACDHFNCGAPLACSKACASGMNAGDTCDDLLFCDTCTAGTSCP